MFVPRKVTVAAVAAMSIVTVGCASVNTSWTHEQLSEREIDRAQSGFGTAWKIGEGKRYTHAYAALFNAKNSTAVGLNTTAASTINTLGSVAAEQSLNLLSGGIDGFGLGLGLLTSVLPDPYDQMMIWQESWSISKTSISLVRFYSTKNAPNSKAYIDDIETSFNEAHQILTSLNSDCVPRLIAEKLNKPAPAASVLDQPLTPRSMAVSKGNYHTRTYSCRPDLEATAKAQRISEFHPLAKKGMKDMIVAEIRLYLHDKSKQPESDKLYSTISERIPAEWTAVFPVADVATGRQKIIVAKDGTSQTFALPVR